MQPGRCQGCDLRLASGSEINGFAVPFIARFSVVQQIRLGDESSDVRVGPAAFLGVELRNPEHAACRNVCQ